MYLIRPWYIVNTKYMYIYWKNLYNEDITTLILLLRKYRGSPDKWFLLIAIIIVMWTIHASSLTERFISEVIRVHGLVVSWGRDTWTILCTGWGYI